MSVRFRKTASVISEPSRLKYESLQKLNEENENNADQNQDNPYEPEKSILKKTNRAASVVSTEITINAGARNRLAEKEKRD